MKDKVKGTHSIVTDIKVGQIDQEVKGGKLNSFTFNKQKKFGYIEIIGTLVEEKIPQFAEIWPFLGAYTFNGAWEPDIDEDLEFIGIAHYTILKSLSYVYQNKDSVSMNDPSQRFKNIIFHYALIIDCIKQISFHITKFKCKLDPEVQLPIKKLSRDAFITKMTKWYDDEYEDRFKDFLNSGGLIMQEIHSSKNFLTLLKKGKNFRSYHKFSNSITPYRNVFIHNPSIDIFHSHREPFVVRSEYIKNNRTLQSIHNLEKQDLINPKELMEQIFEQSIKMLADVWAILLNEIEIINTHPKFPNQRLRNDKI